MTVCLRRKNDLTLLKSKIDKILKKKLATVIACFVGLVGFYWLIFSGDNVQAKNIAVWRNFEKEVNYISGLYKIFQEEENGFLSSEKAVAPEKILAYFEKIKPLSSLSSFEQKLYKYRYLNGERVLSTSDYYMQEVYSIAPDLLLGFSKLNDFCTDSVPCARIFVDVNAQKLPNKFGKDIFGFNIYKSKIKVFGYGVSEKYVTDDCSATGSGVYCSYYFSGGSDLN